jgi:hypothetical protein
MDGGEYKHIFFILSINRKAMNFSYYQLRSQLTPINRMIFDSYNIVKRLDDI